MIQSIETKELHACDICKRRIHSTSIKKCCVCNKELCLYCRIRLSRSVRKHPDSGYSIRQEFVEDLCIECGKSKLGLEIKKLNYS